ncbi:MAG: transcriptional repressor [Candidatus Omnitrophica bacterium]|nr:transcriptional repressor [Candidatus Omnitrophota bacterium]
MLTEKDKRSFQDYLAQEGLKLSDQRMKILEIVLQGTKHLTANEIYKIVQRKYSGIGYATIYRTLRLLCEAGLCLELKCEDGVCRYEHAGDDVHHDHLICTKCGRFVEVVDPQIERLQEKLFKDNGFFPQRHRMELYGICKKCKG